jgi:methyl-accepting chemotaxis protein
MTTKVATALASGSVPEVKAELLRKLDEGLGGRTPALALVFASTQQPLGELLPGLARRWPAAVVLGASTAGEFTERGDAKGAAVVVAIAGDYRVFAGLGEGLRADPEGAVNQAVGGLPTEVEGYPYRTAILLLDPLAGNGEEVTLLTAAVLGEGVRLAGGAAGDDLRMTGTLVGLGERAVGDALVVAMVFSRQPLGVGASHKHVPLSGPLRVTRAEGNRVVEIDGQPAYPLWLRETHERAAQAGIDPAALDEGALTAGFLLRYEAGLATGGEYKIRAPLSVNQDGSLNFACGVPEGSVFRIMESFPAWQIESAREAARLAREQLGGGQVAGAVVFDCICRNLILGEGFGGGDGGHLRRARGGAHRGLRDLRRDRARCR